MLLLASASPRRRQLLTEHGYAFTVRPADVEEQTPPGLDVAEITLFNARQKAEHVARLLAAETEPCEAPNAPPSGEFILPNAAQPGEPIIVIGVDTLVAFEQQPLGKPSDMDDAFAMLSRLNGRIHEVYSAIWAIRVAGPKAGEGGSATAQKTASPFASVRATVEVSRVQFHALDEPGLRRYLARIHPLDKAGAYAAQDESGESIVAHIEGSRTNVIGLPMEALGRLLAAFP